MAGEERLRRTRRKRTRAGGTVTKKSFRSPGSMYRATVQTRQGSKMDVVYTLAYGGEVVHVDHDIDPATYEPKTPAEIHAIRRERNAKGQR